MPEGHNIETDRLRMHYYQSGPPDGEPVVLIHGNLATGRFFDGVMESAPDRYRMIAPDMRTFGRTAPEPIDATRGLRDWADDTASLVSALGIDRPVHLVGWSTGGAAIAAYAIDRTKEVASLTFIDPVSPYGFGGTRGRDGQPTTEDFAGSGGGSGSPDFAATLSAGDTGTDSAFSPRNVMRTSYWSGDHSVDPDWEDLLVDEVVLSATGNDGYPGDMIPSNNWPGFAPGKRGILNALSGKYCNWSAIVDIEPKPPFLWTHGSGDIVVADGSAWDIATLGQAGVIPGWPGEDAHPPQPMVSQIRAVLERYEANGGEVTMKMFDGSGHGPHIDGATEWQRTFFSFLSG